MTHSMCGSGFFSTARRAACINRSSSGVLIDLFDLVDDLTHQLTRFHVVVGVFEHATDDRSLFAARAADFEPLQGRKQIIIDEIEQRIAGDALRIGSPIPPAPAFRNRRDVAIVEQLPLLVLIVDDLEEKHPAQLRNSLSVAINTSVLPHDVLDRLDKVSYRHASPRILINRRLEFAHRSFEIGPRPELFHNLNRCTDLGERCNA